MVHGLHHDHVCIVWQQS